MNNMPMIDLNKCNLTPLEMTIAKIAIKGEKELSMGYTYWNTFASLCNN